MEPASIINFLSNEDTQELAPGFFIRPGKAEPAARCTAIYMGIFSIYALYVARYI
jgi:uncharacterized membrane protein